MKDKLLLKEICSLTFGLFSSLNQYWKFKIGWYINQVFMAGPVATQVVEETGEFRHFREEDVNQKRFG